MARFVAKPSKALLIALGVLPALVLLWDIQRCVVNVPFMDDWQFVPLLEKAREGTLTFQELWAPHDEHRLLIPRIVIIAAMFASHGDYRVQSYITFAVVAVISGCFLRLALQLNGARSGVFWTWALANVALFSPIQFHNWLWPMQFAYFLPYTFFALCLCVLYAPLTSWVKFLLAAVLALAGNYSFVQGNLIWLATLPVILLAPGILRDEERRRFAAAWAIVGILAVFLYFRGLEHNAALPQYAQGHYGDQPTLSTVQLFQKDPVHTLSMMGWFILGMLGNSIARGFPVPDNLRLSHFCGAIVLLLAVAGLLVAWRRGRLFNHALPWASLLLFTFLTAAFVSVGRAWSGEAAPLTPRYTTFGCFCIVSLIEILAAGLAGLPEQLSEFGPLATAANRGLFWSCGLLTGLYLSLQGVNWSYGRRLMDEWSLVRWRSRARLHFIGKVPTQAHVDLLGGKDAFIEEMAAILEKLGMLNPPRASDLKISKLGQVAKGEVARTGRQNPLVACGQGWLASGIAVLPDGRPADAVVLGVESGNGKWVAIAVATPEGCLKYLVKSTCGDLGFLGTPQPVIGEWKIELPQGALGNRSHGLLRAWAMDFRLHILYRLRGDQELTAMKGDVGLLQGQSPSAGLNFTPSR